ncbi:hypothetical protein FXN63_06515 [Pigmentiphaga aceris]|uniref:SWIM-type domain-containing protein n=1 Tax=Pigmentiphaga aceris TaxID=1940612 RepID=A0A5C0AY68_9BURK|nr:SWIM zinc finger family protein [Pigmentiphaga aceris]QEI05531.1 hypothetical protein FXN63_06515 [Pigmentiphaga aceris]
MIRHDLLALSDDGLAQLANVGLVKRGRRDVAEGKAPTITVSDDGSVQADFADGTVTKLAPDRSLIDATCTCPASGVCRHRVTLVLAYQAQQSAGGGADVETAASTSTNAATSAGQDAGTEAGQDAGTATGSSTSTAPDQDARKNTSGTTSPAARAAWDPAELDADAFTASLSAPLRTELTRLRAARLDVRLEQGAIPAAHLPMATVRFLVPHVLAYARCDCVAGGNCVHVALAIQAFKQARGATETRLEPIDSGTGANDTQVGNQLDAKTEARLDALRVAGDALLARLLDVGLSSGPDAFAQPLADARAAATTLGAVQYLLALDGLSQQIDAYAARSARHNEMLALQYATELYARTRTTDPRVALGIGESLETAMSRTRLVSLGARLRGDAGQVDASVMLADLDTGAVMVLERRITQARDTKLPSTAVLAQRQFSSGMSLSAAAHGQILTSSGKRRVDGRLVLGSQRGGLTQTMPYDGNAALRAPLMVANVDELIETLSARPPAFVRRHDATGDVRVFEIEEVLGQALAEGGQCWHGAVQLTNEGGVLRLQRRYDAVAPQALEALTRALSGQYGKLRRIVGPVYVESDNLICDPWLIMADRLLVPDLEAVPAGAASNSLPHHENAAATPLEQALQLLAGAVHVGRRTGPNNAGVRHHARTVAESLNEAGYRQGADYLSNWSTSSNTSDSGPNGPASFGNVACFIQAIR